jgi:hypothetical protein
VVIDVAVIVLPDIHQLLPIFTRWHSAVPTVAQGSLEALVQRVEAQVDGKLPDECLITRGLHHTRHFLREFAPSSIR